MADICLALRWDCAFGCWCRCARVTSRCYDNRMDSLLALQSDRFVAGVNPALGGTLAFFGSMDDAAMEFVRPTPVRAYADRNPRATAGYPLVPYSNRIGDGRFSFEGVDYALDLNS